MSNQIDDNLKNHISELCSNHNPLRVEDFYVDTIVSIQKVIQIAEEIKKQIVRKQCKVKIPELLLLSIKFEIISSDLIVLKHEYNL